MRRLRPLVLLHAAATLALLVLLSLQAESGSAQGGEVLRLSGGFRHTCAVTTAGAVKCWGNAGNGRLGNGQTSPNQIVPIDPIGLSDGLTALAAGWGHTCALTADGEAFCWGNNFRGALGDGTETDRHTAVPVCANAACGAQLTGAADITAGDRHTCVLMNTGGVKCWGSNLDGQLGDGQACDPEACPTPVDVVGLAGPVVTVSAGTWHTCAILDTGAVQCWGFNNHGQLGDGTTTSSNVPVTVAGISGAVAFAGAAEHSCAVLSTGGVKCWGRNTEGQLGDGQVCGTPDCLTPVDVTGVSDASAITSGEDHTCAMTSTGGVTCWGGSSEGQLGDNLVCGLLYCTTPVVPAGLNSGVVAIEAGTFHTCALLSNSKVQCWGANGSGQLGDGAGGHFDDFSPVPADVVGLGGADSDGDTMNDGADPDDDNDGCPDAREMTSNAALGGRRSPKVFWDLFDTPDATNARDKIISVGDLFRIVGRFGTNGSPKTDPLSMPPASGYHTAFDRSPPAAGGEPWDLNEPDGSISVGDIVFLVNQFGHSCA